MKPIEDRQIGQVEVGYATHNGLFLLSIPSARDFNEFGEPDEAPTASLDRRELEQLREVIDEVLS